MTPTAPAAFTPHSAASGVGGPVVDTGKSPHARLQPLPLRDVHLSAGFWRARQETIRHLTLREQYEQCERTGRIDNFRRASGRKEVPFRGKFYDDSDVYKWLEAACYALAERDDADLAALVDGLIDDILAAQAPDGYLNTYFTFERETERWTDLFLKHELYCAGHLIQAAIAHRRATGSRTLLDAAIRLADHICHTFGPGGRPGACGHQEVELALVELYRETGNARYLELARTFLDRRGTPDSLLKGVVRFQDHLPVREQSEIVGHAVRAVYMAIAMADVAIETGEVALSGATERLWASAFQRKAYITGGLGARWEHEAFGDDYELPNERAYAETCAAIGGFMWNWRMLLLTGEAKHADWMETALYSGILSGISLDGTEYFYQNSLADRGAHRRTPWFATACCPPNIARLLLSLQGYAYTTSAGAAGLAAGVWIHHYVPGSVHATLPDRTLLSLLVETRYPWDGEVRMTVEDAPAGERSLFLRVPGWCGQAQVRVSRKKAAGEEQGVPGAAAPSSYVEVRREWRRGDVVTLELAMPPRKIAGDERVAATRGRVALARGPIVYCLEHVDNPGFDVWRWTLRADAPLTAAVRPDLLGGVVVLQGEQPRASQGTLFTAVPYYAWANREAGPMSVWLLSAEESERASS